MKILFILLCLFLSGCKEEAKPVPPQTQWGVKGQAPTAVFNDYDWFLCDRAVLEMK